MAMYCRSKMTGETVSVSHTSVFKNTSPKDYHTRMLTFNLGIPDETYIVMDRVNVVHVCGTPNLTKVYIEDIDDDTWKIIKEFHSCITNMYPDYEVDPLNRRELKLVMKNKWYRSYDKDGIEVNPSYSILNKMMIDERTYKNMSFQIHVHVIRTHKNRILFQPMVRKVLLH